MKKILASLLAVVMLFPLTACGGSEGPVSAGNHEPAQENAPAAARSVDDSGTIDAQDVMEKALEEAEELDSFSLEAVEYYLAAYGLELATLKPTWEWELKSKYSTYADAPDSGYGHAVVQFNRVGTELTDEEINGYFAQVFAATAAISDDGYNIVGYEFAGEGEDALAQVSLETALDSWMPGWGFRNDGKFMVVYVSSAYDREKDSELDRLFYYNAVSFDIGVGLQKSFDETWAEMEQYMEENEDEIKEALDDYLNG